MNMYEVIGNKIQSSLNLIAGDVVVWLSLDGMSVTTLYRIDDGYGQWEDDWYEGQKDVRLIDYCLLDDLKPVVHAHKVRVHSQGGGTHWVVCSHCEKPIDWQDAYCKHCGAIMDEEAE